MPYTAYKYRKWDNYAKRIITHQELYFADPTTFNDIFDCQAYGFIGNYQFADNPFIITGDLDVHHINGNPSALLNWSVRRNLAKCGVCCFSKSYDSILMWSHYADYNRGVCFNFDLNIIELKNGLFGDITYVKNKPKYDFCDPNADKSKWFYCKNRVWKYEREIRGLIFPPSVIKDERYRKVKFPKEALKEIIFGAHYTDKNTYSEIIDLCREHGFNNVRFSFMQGSTDTDSYKLHKVLLSILPA